MSQKNNQKELPVHTEPVRGFIGSLAMPALIVGVYAAVFYCFHRYDWGHPFVKAACYATLFLLICFVASRPSWRGVTKAHMPWKIAIIAVVLISLFAIQAHRYLPYVNKPARCDIGYTTHDAVRMAVLDHQDPYKSTTLTKLGKDTKYWGYHYGPAMPFFYLPSAWFTSAALKVITVIYLLVLLWVIALLLRERGSTRQEWLSSILFALLLIIIPERAWYEITVQGSTDVLPALLILLSLYCIERKSFMAAGIFAGLSFSAKFSPALFFIVLFIRRDINFRFFGGLALAAAPMIGYLAWSGMPMINNMVLFHAVKTFDSTSLHSVTPAGMHFIFPAVQVVALLVFILLNFNKEIEVKRLAASYTLLLIVIEMMYQEVHCNHIIWFIPMLALIFSWYRHGELSVQLP
jgi:hypothetical protein